MEVIDSRDARVIRLWPDGSWEEVELGLPRGDAPFLRAAPMLRDGRRLVLYGIRADPARSSRRWHVALYQGATPVHVHSPGTVLGVRFDAWSAAELPDGSVVLGIAATGDAQGRALPGGLLRMWPDGSEPRWLWRPGLSQLKAPIGLSLTPAGTFLVTDSELNLVTEVDTNGQVVRTLDGSPGDRFKSPGFAAWTPDGVLVSDRMNDRAVLFDAAGRRRWYFGRGPEDPVLDRAGWTLAAPACAVPDGEGHVLISDTGNCRVIKVTTGGDLVTAWGVRSLRARLFSFPRSVEPVAPDRLLVTDGNHNRVVVVDQEGRVSWRFGDGRPGGGRRLHWPRAARLTGRGTVLIADGLNSRLLEVDWAGRVVWQATSATLASGQRLRFADPHDVCPLPDGLLCVDSDLRAVIEIDGSGRVRWSYGLSPDGQPDGSLVDPHQAIRRPDGSTMITDPYHHRIMRVSAAGELEQVLRCQRDADGTEHPLVKCRPVKEFFGGWVTADDNGRVRFIGADGENWGIVGPELTSGTTRFKVDRPRDLAVLGPSVIVVADYEGGRIVYLELDWDVPPVSREPALIGQAAWT
jgi:hypothetical protein